MLVLLLKRDAALGNVLRLAHDLDLDAFGADVVEYQLAPRRALDVYPGAKANLRFRIGLTRFEVAPFIDEVTEIIIVVEFVGVWIGVLGLAELADGSRSYLKVLLDGSPRQCDKAFNDQTDQSTENTDTGHVRLG